MVTFLGCGSIWEPVSSGVPPNVGQQGPHLGGPKVGVQCIAKLTLGWRAASGDVRSPQGWMTTEGLEGPQPWAVPTRRRQAVVLGWGTWAGPEGSQASPAGATLLQATTEPRAGSTEVPPPHPLAGLTRKRTAAEPTQQECLLSNSCVGGGHRWPEMVHQELWPGRRTAGCLTGPGALPTRQRGGLKATQ